MATRITYEITKLVTTDPMGRNAKGKSRAAQLFKLVYVECVYSIWMERNIESLNIQAEVTRTLPKKSLIFVIYELMLELVVFTS